MIQEYVEIGDCLGISFYRYKEENACAVYAKGHQIGNFSREDAQFLV